jgi:hypothetical protein
MKLIDCYDFLPFLLVDSISPFEAVAQLCPQMLYTDHCGTHMNGFSYTRPQEMSVAEGPRCCCILKSIIVFANKLASHESSTIMTE